MGTDEDIERFLADWPEDANFSRDGFEQLYRYLQGLEGVELEFHARPGITYSLRGVRSGSTAPLFAMVDVIDDQPRWLSVCFYEQMVTDPEGRGDSVPGGLLGEDGLCFDLDSDEAALIGYVRQRIGEAWQASGA